MPAATQCAFDSSAIPKRTRPSRAVPAAGFGLELGKRLIEAEGMTRISGRPAAQFLGIDLPDAERGLRLDRGGDQIGRRCRDRVIERARGAGRKHLQAGERARHRHRLCVELERQRQQDVGDPVLQQVAVGHALEQRVPVVLVHVDQAGHHDRAGRVDHFIKAVRPRRLCGRPHGGNPGAIDRDKALGMDAARAVHRNDITVRDQYTGHDANAQYDFGRPSARSAMKLRMSCGVTGAIRQISTSRK